MLALTEDQPSTHRMIDTTLRATDLIGYLSFDIISRQATLVVCGARGRALREVALIPIGSLGRMLVRLGIRLGRYDRSCRAVALDDCDGRTFSVWLKGADRLVVSDERGEFWLRSIDETTAAVRRASSTTPARGVVTRLRRYGFGDASPN